MVRPNRLFDEDAQRHCAASRAREHKSRGAMPLRAGQLRRWADKDDILLELDCTNLDTAAATLAQLVGMPTSDLLVRMANYSCVEFEEDCRAMGIEPAQVLWERIVGAKRDCVPDLIMWFHGTRVSRDCRFSEGILPLNCVLGRLTASLSDLACSIGVAPTLRADSCDARCQANFQRLFDLKTNDSQHWGPYAFLTRDALVDPDLTGHYLEAPEIVEDIAWSKYGDSAELLLRAFRERTSPCIVQFRDARPREDVAEVALQYVYDGVCDNRPLGSSHTCFDGRGHAVSAETIVRIEFLA